MHVSVNIMKLIWFSLFAYTLAGCFEKKFKTMCEHTYKSVKCEQVEDKQ